MSAEGRTYTHPWSPRLCGRKGIEGECDTELWNFGAEILNASINVLKLRYKLRPYLYSSFARAAASEGYTVMRALPFDFPSDHRSRGDHGWVYVRALRAHCADSPAGRHPKSLFAKSHFSSGKTGEANKTVQNGNSDWVDFWTGKWYSAGQEVEVRFF